MTSISVFWPQAHDYIAEGLIYAVENHGVQARLHVLHTSPLDEAIRARGVNVTLVGQGPRTAAADIVLQCGWHLRTINREARRARAGTRLLYFDTQMKPTVRQRVRTPVARLVMPRLFDGCFVPGARQVAFARSIGFHSDAVSDGALTYAVERFERVPALSPANVGARRRFVFVGRLIEEKALDVLQEAYARYRSTSEDPWELLVVGEGSVRIEGEGITGLGRLGHDRLPEVLAQATALLLPSRSEAWGAVVLEAAAAGLLCVVSTVAGAADDLVRDGVNGRTVAPESVGDLASVLADVASWRPEAIAAGGMVSRDLASRYAPDRWFEKLIGQWS